MQPCCRRCPGPRSPPISRRDERCFDRCKPCKRSCRTSWTGRRLVAIAFPIPRSGWSTSRRRTAVPALGYWPQVHPDRRSRWAARQKSGCPPSISTCERTWGYRRRSCCQESRSPTSICEGWSLIIPMLFLSGCKSGALCKEFPLLTDKGVYRAIQYKKKHLHKYRHNRLVSRTYML